MQTWSPRWNANKCLQALLRRLPRHLSSPNRPSKQPGGTLSAHLGAAICAQQHQGIKRGGIGVFCMLACEVDPQLVGKGLASVLRARRGGPAGVQ